MNNLKTNIFLSIPYLTVCGGLYHIAYWSTFHINGLAYLGIQDLIKSSIYPVLSFTVTFFVGFVVVNFFNSNRPPGGGRDTPLGKFLNKKWITFILVLIWLFTEIILYSKGELERWVLWTILGEIVPTLFLFNTNLWREAIESVQLRFSVIQAFVLIPLISIASGKYNSESIRDNYKYEYTVSTRLGECERIHTDTLKFLGSTESELFFTDLNNTTTFMINVGSIDTLKLKQFNKAKR